MARLEQEEFEALVRAAFERHLGEKISIEGARRLTGGASRETWSFDAIGPSDGELRPLILRRDPAKTPLALDRTTEGTLIELAQSSGVAAPKVLFLLDESDSVLAPGFVMERIEGETIPRKILRDDEFVSARPLMAAQCGEILARIHEIDATSVEGLPVPPEGEHPAVSQINQYRQVLDTFGEPHPAFELGLRWLAENLPPSPRVTLVHGDFRNGNFIVGPEGIRAILDWELARIGDPIEDIGWLCVRSWRFGSDENRVGGFGSLDELAAAYEKASGFAVDPEAVRFWELFGTLKWGVICIVQAFTHLNNLARSVELAALGRRVCEMEYDVMELLPA